jgi:hypothetical protein
MSASRRFDYQSFRDGPKDQTRNLEIPGSVLRIAPEWLGKGVLSRSIIISSSLRLRASDVAICSNPPLWHKSAGIPPAPAGFKPELP